MLGCLVCRGCDHHRPVVVGVVERPPRERRVVERAQRLLDHRRPPIGGVQHRLGEAVDVGDERLADPQLHDHAVGARAQGGGGVGLAGRVLDLPRTVAVLHVVVGVVVVVHEVPARDVVVEAVAVVIGSVGEGQDQVFRCEHAGGPVAERGQRARPVEDRGHPGVAGVSEQVEHPQAEHVVGDGSAGGRRAAGLVVVTARAQRP